MPAPHSPENEPGETTAAALGAGRFAGGLFARRWLRFDPATRARVTAAELEVDAAHARLMSRFGAPIWASFALYDVLQASRPDVGHLPELLLFRAAGTVLLLALAVWARRSPNPSRTRIELSIVLSGMLLSLCVSLMSLYDGGFTSVYSPGIALVMFAMASMPRPFRRSLRVNTLVLLPYPVVLCAAALLSPRHAALVREPGVIAAAVQFHFTVLATAAFVALMSHSLWSLRRELLAAQSLGRYRLTRALGQGPQGEVWAAYHHGLRREVAVKALHKGDAEDAGSALRFEQAIHALGGLTHPNNARVYDFGFSDDGRPYYAMELLEGETLPSLIAREGPLSVLRATRLVLQVARALSEAHARGLVHQNLKPENVFITKSAEPRDFVKVLDYGLSAPCAASSAVDATPAADVYAVGALYFLLLTGEPVLKEELMGAEHERAPSPSRRLGQALPDRIESLVVRCLESDAQERFCNARELSNALEACLALVEGSSLALRDLPAALSRAHDGASDEPADSEPTHVESPEELGLLRMRSTTADDSETVVSR